MPHRSRLKFVIANSWLQVFRKITKQLPQLNSLDLQYVSPKLLGALDLDLAVPGKTLKFYKQLSVT